MAPCPLSGAQISYVMRAKPPFSHSTITQSEMNDLTSNLTIENVMILWTRASWFLAYRNCTDSPIPTFDGYVLQRTTANQRLTYSLANQGITTNMIQKLQLTSRI